VEISNLTGMEKIVKLQLDNNIIVKIQGLDQLVNLKWLDLSFNLIEKIEGLDKNKELEDLSLYSNCITDLSGDKDGKGPLDDLVKLNVLSVGRNKLTKLDEMLKYLQRFKRLQVLKIEENEFKQEGKSGKDNAYRNKAIAMLKNLQYLDYKIISKDDRIKAVDEMKEQMAETHGDDENGKKEEDDEESLKELKEAKIEVTHKLWLNIVSACEEYKKLFGF
jgi:Leucine-rich repeat (LRR) protein